MNKQQQQKIVQYLNEAHGSELALVRQLQAQIAMTPRASTATASRPTSRRPAGTPSASSAVWASSGRATTPCRPGWARPEP